MKSFLYVLPSVLLFSPRIVLSDMIYSQDFSSAPTLNETIDNSNTNFAGTDAADDLNQNEWYRRGRNGFGDLTYDAANEDLDLTITSNNIVYNLIDLSTELNDPGAATDFTLSIDVKAISGTVNFFAYAGGGLDYNGTDAGNGHLFFRTYNDLTDSDYPDLFQARQGATTTNIIDGNSPQSITTTGTFTSSSFSLGSTGVAGDYMLVGFFGPGSGTQTITLDNLQITAVPEPSNLALLAVAVLVGFPLMRRRMV